MIDLDRFFAVALDLLCIASVDGRFLRVNPQWERVLGYTLGELQGCRFLDLVHPDDQAATLKALSDLQGERAVLDFVNRYRCKDGSYRWIEWRSYPAGNIVYAAARDITARIRAEKELQEGEARLSAIVDRAPFGAHSYELQTGNQLVLTGANRAAGQILGINHAPLIGQTIEDAFPGLRTTTIPDTYRHLAANGGINEEEQVIYQQGEISGVFAIHAFHTGPGRMSVFFRDITERRKAEEARRQSERRYRSLFDNALEGIFQTTPEGAILAANPALARIMGYETPEALIEDRRHVGEQGYANPEHRSDFRQLVEERGLVTGFEFEVRRKDGTTFWVSENAHVVRDDTGRVLYYEGSMSDITARKEAEQKLRESEARYRTLFDANPQPLWVYDLETLAFLAVNDAAVAHYGYAREEFMAMTIADIRPSRDLPRLLDNLAHVAPNTLDRAGIWQHRIRDGSLIEVEITSHELTFQGRRAELVLAHDVTAHKKAEQALRDSEAKFARAFHTSPDAININRLADGAYVEINQGFTAVTGYTAGDVLGRSSADIGLWVNPEDRAQLIAALKSTGSIANLEASFRAKDGRLRTGLMSATLLEIKGEPHILSITRDITERQRAEEERQRLQAQLIQAQKMEAIGQLAGGVAHDFNNIIAAMMMHLGLLQEEPNLSPEVHTALSELQESAKRAANLTRQLLVFSRRQVIQKQLIDLDSLLGNLLKMLRRLIGENISLEFKVAGAPLWINADSGMVEQVVINLIVNARDAMPKGGRITLTTHITHLDPSCRARNPESRPGPFVCLTVSDTGCGMDESTLKRIFEPFFTTKETGKGTGLGLATVYGIAQRHEGWIEVESQIDLGTTFHVFLPASPARAAAPPSTSSPHPVRGGHESILLVEDDPAVRDQVATVLQRAGYRVLKAANGQLAMTLWAGQAGDVDLLLTDMVMPEGLTGLELAQNLRQQHPRLKVVIMSGYNLEFALQGVPTKDQIHYLPKPFEISQLAQVVRRCLDAG